jgi:hypothetical protein
MERHGYSGGTTTGGMIGCATSALVCIPLCGFAVAYIYDRWDNTPLVLSVFVVVGVIAIAGGLACRSLANWALTRLG